MLELEYSCVDIEGTITKQAGSRCQIWQLRYEPYLPTYLLEPTLGIVHIENYADFISQLEVTQNNRKK